MIRIVLADNQPIFRAGTARVLDAEKDIRLLAQCDNADSLLEAVADARASVVLLAQSLDVNLEQVFAVSRAGGNHVVLITDTASEVPPPILSRLDGLLTRHVSAADLLQCVRRVGQGERTVLPATVSPADGVSRRILGMLTLRELQVVGFVVRGFKNRQIADEMATREQVIKNYLRSIYDKTGSSDRLELALFTLHHRLLAQGAAQAVAALREANAKAQP